jgi:hypothetical protein
MQERPLFAGKKFPFERARIGKTPNHEQARTRHPIGSDAPDQCQTPGSAMEIVVSVKRNVEAFAGS